MGIFRLPQTTQVDKIISKNKFEGYINTRQKALFTDLISRITWLYKLSADTINLDTKKIKEIQIFQIELKKKEKIPAILNIIDKSIPYTIIFIVKYEAAIYLSTSVKHPHPARENNSIIDWTFKTDWFAQIENEFPIILKTNLDITYRNFCAALSPIHAKNNMSIEELVKFSQKVETLEKEVAKLKAGIKKCKQFNQKVDLNIQLKEKESQLASLRWSEKKV